MTTSPAAQAEGNLALKIIFKPEQMDANQAQIFAAGNIPALIEQSNGDEELLGKLPASSPEILLDEEGRTVLKIRLLGIPRHPAMVYEAISTLILFLILLLIWQRNPHLPEGRLFGLFVTILFSLRFFYEFLKENQVEFEDSLSLNMGQLLSIPLVLAGIFLLVRSGRNSGENKKDGNAI